MIDYRELLYKYMRLVGEEEGITFVSRAGFPDFTPEEREELRQIERETKQ